MFTIKAYSNDGSRTIYEAYEIKIRPDKKILTFYPSHGKYVERYVAIGEGENKMETVYIENIAGKTIEKLGS